MQICTFFDPTHSCLVGTLAEGQKWILLYPCLLEPVSLHEHTLLQALFAHSEQAPPGQIFKVKTGRAHKKLRGGGGVATSVGCRGEEGGGDWVEKRGGSSC